MRYLALVVGYDETLASGGELSEQSVRALHRVRTSGRRVIRVTGRRLADLPKACEPRLFDSIVAENGGVVYAPGNRERLMLGEAPSDRLVQALREGNVDPLHIGHVLIATA